MPSISKTVILNNVEYTVQRINLIGTNVYIYSAWVELDGHHTLTYDDNGKALGKVGSEPISTTLQALPAYSQEREDSVRLHFAQRYDAAYAAIFAAFGDEASYGKCSMGEVEIIRV